MHFLSASNSVPDPSYICKLWFLIDGQKIAKKLGKGITKETSTAKHLLNELNASLSQADVSFVHIPLADVLSPVSDFWQCHSTPSHEIPSTVKRDIIEAFLLQKRCKEELSLLQSEMQNVIDYYNQKEAIINNVLHEIANSEENQYTRGCICLLKKLKLEVELFRSKAASAYSSVIPVSVPLFQTGHESDSECNSSSDDELSDDQDL